VEKLTKPDLPNAWKRPGSRGGTWGPIAGEWKMGACKPATSTALPREGCPGEGGSGGGWGRKNRQVHDGGDAKGGRNNYLQGTEKGLGGEEGGAVMRKCRKKPKI